MSDPPTIPQTLVLEPGLVVHGVHNEVTREIGADRDLSQPRLRLACDTSGHGRFYGWRKLSRHEMPTSCNA